MKTVLFAPGFQEGLESRNYQATLDAIEARGYKTEFIPINWRGTTIRGWVRQMGETYEAHDPAQTILAGFSFGAMTAFLMATTRMPSQLWLFSLSPYFADDMDARAEQAVERVGRRRVRAFSTLDFNQLAASVTCPTLLVAGESEILTVRCRAEAARQAIAHSQLVVAKDCEHDVTDPRYIAAIQQAIEQ